MRSPTVQHFCGRSSEVKGSPGRVFGTKSACFSSPCGSWEPSMGQGNSAPGWPDGVAHCQAPKHFTGLVHADVGMLSVLEYFYEITKEVNYDPSLFFLNFSKILTIFHLSTSIKLSPVSHNSGLDKALMKFSANSPSLDMPHQAVRVMYDSASTGTPPTPSSLGPH